MIDDTTANVMLFQRVYGDPEQFYFTRFNLMGAIQAEGHLEGPSAKY